MARSRVSARPRFGGFAPLDLITMGYAISAALVLVYRTLGTPLELPRAELACLAIAHALLVVLAFLARAARRERTVPCVLAEWYPLVVLVAVYGSIGLINGPQAQAGLSYDQLVQRWEVLAFGRQVAHDWSRWQGPAMGALSWPLSLSYLGFFPLVIAAPLVLWLRGRIEEARQTIFGISLTFFVCYLAFLLFPVAGPQYFWGWPSADGALGWPNRAVQSLIEHGDSWGSAFPSSHVAASMAAALLAYRHWPRLGWILFPFAFGILLGVVFFQVHYALDAVAGVLIALAVVWATARWAPCLAAEPVATDPHLRAPDKARLVADES